MTITYITCDLYALAVTFNLLSDLKKNKQKRRFKCSILVHSLITCLSSCDSQRARAQNR